jgi:hypothetical protein
MGGVSGMKSPLSGSQPARLATQFVVDIYANLRWIGTTLDMADQVLQRRLHANRAQDRGEVIDINDVIKKCQIGMIEKISD